MPEKPCPIRQLPMSEVDALVTEYGYVDCQRRESEQPSEMPPRTWDEDEGSGAG